MLLWITFQLRKQGLLTSPVSITHFQDFPSSICVQTQMHVTEMNAQTENDYCLFIHSCSCKWRADKRTDDWRSEWSVQPEYEFMATKYRAKRCVNTGLTVINLTQSQHQMNVCTNNWKSITMTGPNHLMQTLTKAQGKPLNVSRAPFLPDFLATCMFLLRLCEKCQRQ